MMRLIIICVVASLSGCAATLHGSQTSGGGSTTTTMSSSVHGATQVGNAYIRGSFGTPPPPNAPGGRVAFTSDASGVLLLGLVIVVAVDVVGEWFKPAVPRPEPRTGNISQTCSCYGWQPELTPAPQPQ